MYSVCPGVNGAKRWVRLCLDPVLRDRFHLFVIFLIDESDGYAVGGEESVERVVVVEYCVESFFIYSKESYVVTGDDFRLALVILGGCARILAGSHGKE